jgi:uncharacterized protein with HEPN domain
MLKYCADINETMLRFGDDENIFLSDKDYKNSICMNLMQIGELTTLLPDDFKNSTKNVVNWQKIKGLRNIFAHEYPKVDYSLIWDTIKVHIPALIRFCEEQIRQYNPANQEANEPECDDEDLEM